MSDAPISYQNAAIGGAGSLNTTWQKKGGRITTPANAAKVRVQLYNYMNSGWVAYDDVSLVPASGGSNLVVNPGFESAGNWTQVTQSGFPGTSFYRSTWGTAAPHGGAYGYAISNHAYGYLQSDAIAVSSNVQYDLYTWLRGEVDAEDSFGNWILRVVYYDNSDVQISSFDAAIGGGGSLNTTWQQQGARLTTPANAAKVRIRLMNYMNSGWVVFDHLSLKQVGVYNLTYDAENRLVGVSGAATASFVYDGDSNRVKGVENGTKVYIGNYFEWQVSNGEITRFYYAGSQRIAMRTGTGTGTTGLTFLLGDHLGSTSVSYKANGTQTLRQLYLPWGEVLTGTLETDYGFTGQKSSSFGLMYFKARWFDSSLGRFAQADTIVPGAGNPLAWDRYAGVANNPLRYTDPSGHCIFGGWDTIICAAILVAIFTSGCSASSPVATPANDVERIQYYIDTNQFQEAIDLSITAYNISTTNTNGKVTYIPNGNEDALLFYSAVTYPDARVNIFSGAFFATDIDKKSSPGMLGAIIAHEVEGHVKQIAEERHWSQIADSYIAGQMLFVNEYEAYKWIIDHAGVFNLTEDEIKDVENRLNNAFSKLDENFQSRVKEGNYEAP